MSESQPLLGGGGGGGGGNVLHDHPIFLRVCHSSWKWLDQSLLVYLRGTVLAYLIPTYGMLLHYKLHTREDEHSDWRLIFQFSTITWTIILIYHLIAFSWTTTHLHWPELEEDDQTWESKLLRFMQPPDQPGRSRRRFYFSLFYSLVQTYSIMLPVIYWTVLLPNGHSHWAGSSGPGGGAPGTPPADPGVPGKTPPPEKGDPTVLEPGKGDPAAGGIHSIDDLFKYGWFHPFCLFNLYTFPALLTFYEVVFLNAIKRQVPVPSHIFSIAGLAGLYLGWAFIGKELTGHDPFFWMDETKVGSSEEVAAYCIGFVTLAVSSFSFLYGLIGMRDSIVEERQGRRNNNDGHYSIEAGGDAGYQGGQGQRGGHSHGQYQTNFQGNHR